MSYVGACDCEGARGKRPCSEHNQKTGKVRIRCFACQRSTGWHSNIRGAVAEWIEEYGAKDDKPNHKKV